MPSAVSSQVKVLRSPLDFGGPALDLNFLGGSLDSRITFSRGTLATFVNSSGLIQTVSNNIPRFDYNPVTLAPLGLLIEEARTNSALFSEQFDNATAWASIVGATVTSNTTISPDGLTTADSLIPTAALGTHSAGQTYTATVASWTQSVFVKANGYSKCGLRDSSATGSYATFDLSGAGSVISVGGMTAVITKLNNGWFRITGTFTGTAAANAIRVHVMDNAYVSGDPNLYTYTGDGTSGIYVWGGQAELGAFATSYIPTTSAAVTRNAESATYTNAALISNSEGSIFADFDSVGSVDQTAVSIYQSVLPGNGNYRLRKPSSGFAFLVNRMGASANDIFSVATYPDGTRLKMAGGIGPTSTLSLLSNGALVTGPTANFPPSTFDSFGIGNVSVVGQVCQVARIRAIKYWNKRLSDADLQTLTT